MSSHIYDRSATRRPSIRSDCPRGQKFIASWLSAWQGNQLPAPAAFSPERLRKLKHLLLICAVKPDAGAKVTFAGQELVRIAGTKLVGLDWFSLVSTRDMPERLQRTASVAEGALLRTIREVRLNHGRKYTFEMITAPLRAEEDGTVVATCEDPPDKKAVLPAQGIGERTCWSSCRSPGWENFQAAGRESKMSSASGDFTPPSAL